jgi:hypothetical protein
MSFEKETLNDLKPITLAVGLSAASEIRCRGR